MSVDLKGVNTFPIIRNITAIQTWTEVVLPPKGVLLTVGSEQHDIYVSFEGVDGATVAGVHKVFIKGGGYLAMNRGKGTNQHKKVYVATKSSSTGEVTIILEE